MEVQEVRKGNADMSHVLLTEEQAQQIEEALVATTLNKDYWLEKCMDSLDTIRAARAQEQAEQEPLLWGDDKFAPHERPQEQEPVAKVAALFVQDNGCYMNLKHVDAWPLQRDARKYSGNLPVVAHPPCQLWGSFAAVNYARWGGEHNKPGNDEGCFEAALNSVKRFGGVLEHPAKSRAFSHYGICKPTGVGWTQSKDGGWVCEVWQSAYGHRANKATWLYYFGSVRPFELKWDRPTGSHQIGFYDQRGKENNKPTLGKKEANATPIEFRDELIRLALYAAPVSIHSESETDSSSSSMRTTVRTKDLTDEEIQNAMMPIEPTGKDYFLRLARAVIAKFKEKNNGL